MTISFVHFQERCLIIHENTVYMFEACRTIDEYILPTGTAESEAVAEGESFDCLTVVWFNAVAIRLLIPKICSMFYM